MVGQRKPIARQPVINTKEELQKMKDKRCIHCGVSYEEAPRRMKSTSGGPVCIDWEGCEPRRIKLKEEADHVLSGTYDSMEQAMMELRENASVWVHFSGNKINLTSELREKAILVLADHMAKTCRERDKLGCQ
jgi:hypothetical protein